MSDLERWQQLLKDKMVVLDHLWESLLDDLWQYVPSELTKEVSDLADLFHQSYWEIFHAAVEYHTIEKLSESLVEPLKAANEHVVAAWRTVAFTRVQKLEAEIEKARQTGPAQLAEARAVLRSANACLQNGTKDASADRHFEAINSFKQCILECDAGVDRVDDALRIMQSQLQEINHAEHRHEATISTQEKAIVVSVKTFWATVIGFIVGAIVTIATTWFILGSASPNK